jgi:hypothetical protein
VPDSLPRRLFAIYPLAEDLPQEDLSPSSKSSASGCILCHLHDDATLASLSRLTRLFCPESKPVNPASDVKCACIAPADSPCVPQLHPVAQGSPICLSEAWSRRTFTRSKEIAAHTSPYPFGRPCSRSSPYQICRLLVKTDSSLHIASPHPHSAHDYPGLLRTSSRPSFRGT